VNLPSLTYLTFDSVTAGVGASQVVPYVAGLAQRGLKVSLHSFEDPHATAVAHPVLGATEGLTWWPHDFGRPGAVGGAMRIARGAKVLRGAKLVHARSDPAAASAILARPPCWIWDMRSFWVDERVATGYVRRGSPEERIMRRVERGAARSAAGIVTLARSAISELARRHGPSVVPKCEVVTTCVDLQHFSPGPLPPPDTVRFLLAGTLNSNYNLPLMLELVERASRRRPSALTVLSPGPTPWDADLRAHHIEVSSVARSEMPEQVRAHHVGLSVRRAEEGVSLLAATPTKVGEFLAAGRPVVVNAGLGDLDTLLADYDCGVVVRDRTGGELERALDEIDRLLADDEVSARCRRLAEAAFNLDTGVDRLVALYERAAAVR